MANNFNDTPIAYRLELARDMSPERLAEVARQWKLPALTIRRYLNHLRKTYSELSEAGLISPPHVVPAHFETAWEALCAVTGRDPARPVPAAVDAPDRERRIVCVFSDVHGDPYWPGVEAMLNNEAPDVTVNGGDVTDHAAYSPWRKAHHVDPGAEYANVQLLYERYITPEVCPLNLITLGNHDAWRENYFMNRVDAWAMGEIRDSPLRIMADAYPHVTLVENTHGFKTATGERIPYQLKDTFMIRLGDAVIAHPRVSRKHEGRSVAAFVEEYDKWAAPLDLPRPRLVATGHHHRGAVLYTEAGHRVLVELGVLCNPRVVQYALDAGKLGTPPVMGYLVFEQTRDECGYWLTDLATVRYVLV